MWNRQYLNISQMKGDTILSILGGGIGNDTITFYMASGRKYKMYHEQDCCESVSIDDVNGDWKDIIGTPILSAEESTPDLPQVPNSDESFTWTFYHIRTIKGDITIKWYGSSNGYYSESVSLIDESGIPPKPEEDQIIT